MFYCVKLTQLMKQQKWFSCGYLKGSIPPWLPEDSRRVSPQRFLYLLKNFKTLSQPWNWPHWGGSFFIRRVTDRCDLDSCESVHQGKTKLEYLSFMAQLPNLVKEPNISTWANKINKPTISVSFAVNLTHLEWDKPQLKNCLYLSCWPVGMSRGQSLIAGWCSLHYGQYHP